MQQPTYPVHLGFEPPRRRRLNAFAYLLSLGFREGSLLRPGLVRPLLALDRWTGWLSPLLALRALLVWPSAPPGRVTSAPQGAGAEDAPASEARTEVDVAEGAPEGRGSPPRQPGRWRG